MQGVIAEYERYPNVWIILVMPTAPLSQLHRRRRAYGLVSLGAGADEVGIIAAA